MLDRLAQRWGFAAKIRGNPTLRLLFRIAVGVVGGLVLALGVVLIPYPGPGWLVVFAGLAILATEFSWAGKALAFAKSKYDAWTHWLRRQHWAVRWGVLAATGLIVLLTLWLLNVFGMIAGWFDLDISWLRTPFSR
ncbi:MULTISPECIES: TIGR02611 family protein [unclassified Crossiella]|uniref:TIGR02611 family protein n=1 Tax=unclassified Crossiella TaxID=2620835 RepID=UPI001FFFC01F|nr:MULTISPECIES: TIGR02611 family protein [unclassified Crossiella]MCK2243665.1 TIGR02611 family protein [Crossiella sp. S99.2]MCK2257524.1 TIGR02611 family protein [Crossiella sp. S99.1]